MKRMKTSQVRLKNNLKIEPKEQQVDLLMREIQALAIRDMQIHKIDLPGTQIEIIKMWTALWQFN